MSLVVYISPYPISFFLYQFPSPPPPLSIHHSPSHYFLLPPVLTLSLSFLSRATYADPSACLSPCLRFPRGSIQLTRERGSRDSNYRKSRWISKRMTIYVLWYSTFSFIRIPFEFNVGENCDYLEVLLYSKIYLVLEKSNKK